MTYTIPRPKWKRGDNIDRSMWDSQNNIGCVLYHIGIQCGIEHQDLVNDPIQTKETPIDVKGYLHVWPSWLIRFNRVTQKYAPSRACEAIMEINDDPNISGPICEATLSRIVSRNGDSLIFVE